MMNSLITPRDLVLLCFVFLIFAPLQNFAAEKILYQTGHYKFTQKNAQNLLELAEFIGASRFSKKERKALQIWAINDFKNAPKISVSFYKKLAQLVIPKIRKSKGNNTYRAELYLSFVDSFNKHPEYRKLPDNFLSIIDRHKPPIKEALLIRQLRFNLIMQQKQTNQRLFNQSIQRMQYSNDVINQSIKDQATRFSITAPGGKILQESNGKIYAEDSKGHKYEVNK